jgi:hypothetical protein
MERKHLVVTCSLKIEDRIIDTHTLICCTAMGMVSVDQDLVHHHQLEEKEL